MKYYKLHVAGFSSAREGKYSNLLGTVLDDEGIPVYNLDINKARLGDTIMSENVPLLAADGATVEAKPYTPNVAYQKFANSGQVVRDFDLTFTIEQNGESKAIAAVRLNVNALEALREMIENTLTQARKK